MQKGTLASQILPTLIFSACNFHLVRMKWHEDRVLRNTAGPISILATLRLPETCVGNINNYRSPGLTKASQSWLLKIKSLQDPTCFDFYSRYLSCHDTVMKQAFPTLSNIPSGPVPGSALCCHQSGQGQGCLVFVNAKQEAANSCSLLSPIWPWAGLPNF